MPGQPMEYSIRSIVHHIGNTANSGHYTSDAIRSFPDDQEKPNQWMSFDDGIAMHAGNDVLSNVSKQKTAYMLLYTMAGPTDD
jgi:ubiquitin C-terminal hydrolase